MLRRPLLAVALTACHPTATAPTSEPTNEVQGATAPAVAVDAQRMLATIATLADDKLLGRYTLAPQIHEAAAFLAKRYTGAGLQPVGESMVVPYQLTVGAKLQGSQTLSVQPSRGKAITFGAEAFTPMPMSASAQVEAEAVFVGYAAASDPAEDGSIAYDDLAGVQLEGKIAVVFMDAPNTPDFRALFEVLGRIGEDYKSTAAPLLATLEGGDAPAKAKAEADLLIAHKAARQRIADALAPFMRGAQMPEDFWTVSEPAVAELDIFSMLGPVMRMSREMPGPRFSSAARLGTKLTRLAKAKVAGIVVVRGPRSFLEASTREQDPLVELMPDPPEVLPSPIEVPVVQLRWHDAKKLFKAGGMKLEAVQAKIDESLTPQSAPMKARVTIATKVEPIRVDVPNVLAQIPGGERADEVVLFGAHFDHIGSTALGDCNRIERTDDDICNGADDNASGTAMVLELATAIRESGVTPKRTLMFASFSGEEMGLLGSEAMAANPPFDRERVVAMVNLDMVGRLGAKGLFVGGISSSDAWMPMLDTIGAKGMEVTYERSITSRSDHANWFTHEIPVLFFFTGVHSDYHRAGDHVDEIKAQGMQQIGELVLDLALTLADGAKIDYREPAEQEGLVGRLPGSDEATIEKRVEKIERPTSASAASTSAG